MFQRNLKQKMFTIFRVCSLSYLKVDFLDTNIIIFINFKRNCNFYCLNFITTSFCLSNVNWIYIQNDFFLINIILKPQSVIQKLAIILRLLSNFIIASVN